MSDKLQEICAAKREHVARRRIEHSFADLDSAAKEAPLTRNFARNLKDKVSLGKVGLICEIKKASPSAGLIRADFNPTTLANAYERGGATCLSVLTDEPYFQGAIDFLVEARAACSLPVLRKDFMIDPWQIVESRAIGADCILIIMAAVDNALAQELHDAATSYGMDVLIEVHNANEMERALHLPSGLIGINNRNLKTLKIDLETTENLAPMVPSNRTLVCESGIACHDDIVRMRKANAHCFLVGESLMRQQDVTQATLSLLQEAP